MSLACLLIELIVANIHDMSRRINTQSIDTVVIATGRRNFGIGKSDTWRVRGASRAGAARGNAVIAGCDPTADEQQHRAVTSYRGGCNR